MTKPKKQYITAMVSPRTKSVLEQRARDEGLSLSGFLSRVLDEYVLQPHTPPPTKEQQLASIAAEFD